MNNRNLSYMFLIPILIIFLSTPTNAEAQWQVKIDYNGNWSGAVGGGNIGTNIVSYEGYGDRIISVEGDIISATIQKQDGNSEPLCVEILRGGVLEESGCTNGAYGVVSISASGGFMNSWFSFTLIFGILLGGVLYVMSLKSTNLHEKKKRSKRRSGPTYVSKDKRINTTSPSSNKIPPVYTKPSFQLDGYDWLDYHGKKWRRVTRSFDREWEIYPQIDFAISTSKTQLNDLQNPKKPKYRIKDIKERTDLDIYDENRLLEKSIGRGNSFIDAANIEKKHLIVERKNDINNHPKTEKSKILMKNTRTVSAQCRYLESTESSRVRIRCTNLHLNKMYCDEHIEMFENSD